VDSNVSNENKDLKKDKENGIKNDVLIRGRLLLRNADGSPESDASILSRDGIIVAIGREAEGRIDSSTEVIDLCEHVLVPGLIDSHVHLIWSGRENALYDAIGLARSSLTIQAIVNMQSALARGITTVRDCGGIIDVTIPLARAVENGLITGPMVVTSGSAITTTGGHCWFLETEADGDEQVVEAVRMLHGAGAHFIKVMVTGGGSTVGSDTRVSQYSQGELELISQEAHRHGMSITGHAHGTEGILRSLEADFDGIEHCTWLSRNGEGEDYRPDAVDRIVTEEIFVCKTIAGFQRWPLGELGPHHPAWGEFATMRSMRDAGVSFIAGTDAGIDQTNFGDLCFTLETMVGLGGMSPREAYRSATELAARAIGREEVVGALEIGKRADCIAVEDNPVDDIRTLRSPRGVVQNGRLVARDGRLII
jgi:imidazolonepropionase-like amidohydrolase